MNVLAESHGPTAWWVGAWRRDSICVPGGEPVEPCEAWWLQTDEWFVDVRVARPGFEHNQLPYSQTRAFAGRFEVADDEVRWHLLLDSAGTAPKTDRAAAAGLFIDGANPLLMVEDAPGRFREDWLRPVVPGSDDVEVIEYRTDHIVVRVGEWCGSVTAGPTGDVGGRIWHVDHPDTPVAVVGTAT